jgi:pyruvate dehydrogenase E2 component (dihydrolipoamide acetyltransferase)
MLTRNNFGFALDATKEITMPALSSTMKEGKIVSWTKEVGEKVDMGDVLLVVESDKADMDVESFEEGYLGAIYTQEGGSADVGAVVAVLVDSQEELSTVGSAPPAPAAAAAAPAASETPAPSHTPAAAPAGAADVDFEQVMMPALSSTMKEGKIVSWAKNVGDKIESGDVLLVVESDKADMDVESFDEGYLAKIVVAEGESTEVGQPVALIAKSADEIDAVAAAFSASGSAPAAAPAAPPAAPAPAAPSPAAPAAAAAAAATPAHTPAPGVVSATPMAKKRAKENGIDISTLKGTGNFGRVTEDDVLIAAGKKSVSPPPAAGP